MSNPLDGATIAPEVLNTRGYIEVTFSDAEEGVDASSINGNELAISGPGKGTASLDGSATLVSGTTYRYGFTGAFVDGEVTIKLKTCTFKDLAASPNWNAPKTWGITVQSPPPFLSLIHI